MAKPKLEWGPAPRDRFAHARPLILDGKEIGKFYGHEEDGSIQSINEVLTMLAEHGAIDYDPI